MFVSFASLFKQKKTRDYIEIIWRRFDKLPWPGDDCCVVLCPSVGVIVLVIVVDTGDIGETGEDDCELLIILDLVVELVELCKLLLGEDAV